MTLMVSSLSVFAICRIIHRFMGNTLLSFVGLFKDIGNYLWTIRLRGKGISILGPSETSLHRKMLGLQKLQSFWDKVTFRAFIFSHEAELRPRPLCIFPARGELPCRECSDHRGSERVGLPGGLTELQEEQAPARDSYNNQCQRIPEGKWQT